MSVNNEAGAERADLVPVCEWCDQPTSCRAQDECWRDGRSLFRMAGERVHEQQAAD